MNEEDFRYGRHQHQAEMDRLWEDFSNTLGKVVDKMAGVEAPEVIEEEKEVVYLDDVTAEVVNSQKEEEYTPLKVVRKRSIAEMYESTAVSNKTPTELKVEKFNKGLDKILGVEYNVSELYQMRKEEMRKELVLEGSDDQMTKDLEEATADLNVALNALNESIVLDETKLKGIYMDDSPTMRLIKEAIKKTIVKEEKIQPTTMAYVQTLDKNKKVEKVVVEQSEEQLEEESFIDSTDKCIAIIEEDKQQKLNMVKRVLEEHKAKRSTVDTVPLAVDLNDEEDNIDYFTPDIKPFCTGGYME